MQYNVTPLLQAGLFVRVRGKFWRWCRHGKVTFYHFSSRDGSSTTKLFPGLAQVSSSQAILCTNVPSQLRKKSGEGTSAHRLRRLLRPLFWKTNKKGTHGFKPTVKPKAWPAPHACAHLYHLGMGWVTLDSCFGMA